MEQTARIRPSGSEAEALRASPFFDDLDADDVAFLIAHGDVREFEAGRSLLEQGEDATTLFILLEGEVGLSFRKSPESPGSDPVRLRTLRDSGYPVGWSALVAPYRYRASAVAQTRVRALAMEREMLERHIQERPAFGLAVMRRALWAVGRRLRTARVRLVARRYEPETTAIRALLDQYEEQLPVTSPLHKISYYLENRLTLSDAFDVLEVVRVDGTETERHLARICLDILEGVRRELTVFQYLQKIYVLVARADRGADPVALNRICVEETRQMFRDIPHVVQGVEHLPERPGHLVIMNHLCNHPDYLLPNGFHFTFDTHFVSALLFERYGEPPVRVVRKSGPQEYGHQQYYDPQGHLYVYPAADAEARERQREVLMAQARELLAHGRNIVICPSGASTSQDLSPLPFRSGAFRLAATADPEPLLVPVAVANFDGKITRVRPVAVIHEPIRLSEHVSMPASEEDLRTFAAELEERFRTWVREAAALA